MTDDLKDRFRSLDALTFPHDAGPPDVAGRHPTSDPSRMRRFGTAAFALVIGATALVFAVRAFEGSAERRQQPPADPGDEIETGPGTCDDGPWIEHCPEAAWARTVVDVAGLEIVDEQAVLVLGSPGGDEFLFWAMDPKRHGGSVEPLSEILDDGVAREVDRVDGMPIYGFRSNRDLWVWSHRGLNVWVDGRVSSSPPSRQDRVALIRASASVPYTSTMPPPGVTVPDIVGLRDQQGMLTLDDLGLTWVVAYRTVDGVGLWHIASIAPPAGSRVAPGSTVRILVAGRVGTLPEGAADALDCDESHREAFGGPDTRVLPGGPAYIVGNLPGIDDRDEVVQVTFEDEEWDGLWHVIRGGSVVAVVDYGPLDGVACQGSGVAGA